MKKGGIGNSVEYRMDQQDGSPGIIVQVRILDAEDRHVYRVKEDGLNVEYVDKCLTKLMEAKNRANNKKKARKA